MVLHHIYTCYLLICLLVLSLSPEWNFMKARIYVSFADTFPVPSTHINSLIMFYVVLYVVYMFNLVQFSRSVMSYSLWLHGLQHTRPPCPSPTPGVYLNSCPLSQWCHPTISFSVIPFSSHLQSFPTSGSFQTSQLFSSGGQSTGVSASASVLPMNTQDWSLGGLVGSPCSPRDSQESSATPQFKSINSSVLSFLYGPTLTSVHDHWKNHSLDQTDLCWQSNVSAF